MGKCEYTGSNSFIAIVITIDATQKKKKLASIYIY